MAIPTILTKQKLNCNIDSVKLTRTLIPFTASSVTKSLISNDSDIHLRLKLSEMICIKRKLEEILCNMCTIFCPLFPLLSNRAIYTYLSVW